MAIGSPEPSVEALSAFFVVDRRRSSGDDPVEDARQTLGFWVYPCACTDLPRSCEARAQPIPAAMGAGPPERRWVGTVRPLAAVRPTGRGARRCPALRAALALAGASPS